MSSPSVKSPNSFRSSGGSTTPTTSDCDLNRVHEELEKLNIATDVINKLELQLDEARAAFREIQSGWSQKLEQLAKKLGSCIDKSRPYYEARLKVLEAQQEAQRAALRFERANSMHAVAKQQVALTQEGLDRQGSKNVDPACLEVLNHHIQRVNEAERERIHSEEEHKNISKIVGEASARVSYLEKELKRNIHKSKSYFEARVEFTKVLEKQKELIQRLEVEIKQKKADYNTSLRNLEKISEQIHEQRQLGKRDPGVGSETPGPAKSSPESEKFIDNAEMLKQQMEDEIPGKEDDGRPRSVSAPQEAKLEPQPAAASVAATRYSSGVILLASELSAYDWIKEDVRSKAFSFPPEDLDMQYKTVPEGVKQFPTPPETPSSAESNNLSIPHHLGNELESCGDSEISSLASFSIDDENVEHAMKLPEALINEIEGFNSRKLKINADDDLPERSSGSGAEDA